MRSALDALHAELAAARVRDGEVAPAQLRRLVQLADEAERATTLGDHTSAIRSNRDFHQAIDALADSPVSAAAADRLWERILVSTERSLAVPGRGEIVNREHRELLAAIVAGDGERAGRLAARHVRATLAAAQPAVAGLTASGEAVGCRCPTTRSARRPRRPPAVPRPARRPRARRVRQAPRRRPPPAAGARRRRRAPDTCRRPSRARPSDPRSGRRGRRSARPTSPVPGPRRDHRARGTRPAGRRSDASPRRRRSGRSRSARQGCRPRPPRAAGRQDRMRRGC